MSWQDTDNKKVRGKIDRVFVSPTEHYELKHFVDHYLETNGYKVDDNNRAIVCNAVDKYPGEAPIQRDALTKFLNQQFAKK